MIVEGGGELWTEWRGSGSHGPWMITGGPWLQRGSHNELSTTVAPPLASRVGGGSGYEVGSLRGGGEQQRGGGIPPRQKLHYTTSVLNYRSVDFFDTNFDYSSYSKIYTKYHFFLL